jgi:hypothetical protein
MHDAHVVCPHTFVEVDEPRQIETKVRASRDWKPRALQCEIVERVSLEIRERIDAGLEVGRRVAKNRCQGRRDAVRAIEVMVREYGDAQRSGSS